MRSVLPRTGSSTCAHLILHVPRRRAPCAVHAGALCTMHHAAPACPPTCRSRRPRGGHLRCLLLRVPKVPVKRGCLAACSATRLHCTTRQGCFQPRCSCRPVLSAQHAPLRTAASSARCDSSLHPQAFMRSTRALARSLLGADKSGAEERPASPEGHLSDQPVPVKGVRHQLPVRAHRARPVPAIGSARVSQVLACPVVAAVAWRLRHLRCRLLTPAPDGVLPPWSGGAHSKGCNESGL